MTENKTAKTPTDDGHVAHVYLFDKTGRPMVAWDNAKDIKLGDKLYAAPKREWVGLTADEIWKCNKAKSGSAVEFHICSAHQNVLDFAESIEAKLREKNT
jgi:hypothetical protein